MRSRSCWFVLCRGGVRESKGDVLTAPLPHKHSNRRTAIGTGLNAAGFMHRSGEEPQVGRRLAALPFDHPN